MILKTKQLTERDWLRRGDKVKARDLKEWRHYFGYRPDRGVVVGKDRKLSHCIWVRFGSDSKAVSIAVAWLQRA